MKILVLALNQYKFNNAETKEVVEGVTIEYLTPEPINESTKKGYFPLKQSLSPDEIKNITSIPAVYDVEVSMLSGQNRKATAVFNKFCFVKDVDLKGYYK